MSNSANVLHWCISDLLSIPLINKSANLYILQHIQHVLNSSYGSIIDVIHSLINEINLKVVCHERHKNPSVTVLMTRLCGFIYLQQTRLYTQSWSLIVQRGLSVNGTFHYFSIPNTGEHCKACYLQATDIDNTYDKFCENHDIFMIYSSGKYILCMIQYCMLIYYLLYVQNIERYSCWLGFW